MKETTILLVVSIKTHELTGLWGMQDVSNIQCFISEITVCTYTNTGCLMLIYKPAVWLWWSLTAAVVIVSRSGVSEADIWQTCGHFNSRISQRDLCVPRWSKPQCASLSLSDFPHINCCFPQLVLHLNMYVFPACSLSGSPSVQRWHFAVQASQGVTQVRHMED